MDYLKNIILTDKIGFSDATSSINKPIITQCPNLTEAAATDADKPLVRAHVYPIFTLKRNTNVEIFEKKNIFFLE